MSTMTSPLLELVEACDNYPYEKDYDSRFYRLYLPGDEDPHGYMLPEIVDRMPWCSDFVVDGKTRSVRLTDSSEGTDNGQACTAAFSKTVAMCIEHDLFASIHGEHSEPFAILGARDAAHVERFAAPLFGIFSKGAHLTAYTGTSTANDMEIWVARRSPDSHTYPDMLDTTVGGGVQATETPFENILHEADEEASLPADLIRCKARPTGVLTYTGISTTMDEGLVTPDTVYLYDVEIPEDVKCTPRDHEVKEFTLMSVEEVKKALIEKEFKTNSAVVMIDFLIRHGFIHQENEKAYIELAAQMHRKLPFKTRPA